MRSRSGLMVVVWAVCAGCGGGRAKSATTPAQASVLSTSGGGGEAVTVAENDGDVAEADSGGVLLARAEGTDPAPAPVRATDGKPGVTVLPEQIVVEGWVSVEVEDASATARELRTLVEKLQGRISKEQVTGAAQSWSASISLRIAPARVNEVLDWLDRQGEVTSKRIDGTDVSRTLFDQAIALENLTLTLERLRKLLDAGGLQMKDILEIEKEMTRLRGEIERIKGEKRFLEDRVSLATLNVELSRADGAVMSPRAKIFPGPRFALLTLFAPDGRARNRIGGGVAMHIVIPRISIELDVFDDVEASGDQPREGHAVLATYGAAMYSDFLGRGKRDFLNPYIGFRAGYGYLDYHAFVLQGEIGVELFKHKHMLVDANVRATGLLGEDDVDAGLVSGAAAVFAF